MSGPTKRQLVAAIKALHSVTGAMFSAYQNDVAQGRAENMERLSRKAQNIAQPIIDNFPPGYGERTNPPSNEGTPHG